MTTSIIGEKSETHRMNEKAAVSSRGKLLFSPLRLCRKSPAFPSDHISIP